MSRRPIGLFAAHGVELEYMIVDRESLAVRSIADELLHRAAGGDAYVSDVEHGEITWSNELVAHVIELKTTGPATDLAPLTRLFDREVRDINARLERLGARLMPTAMHPWMLPGETRVWPHDCAEIYAAFDRIFGCQGHGWSNLQSVHLNLPFDGDAQFARLHAAIRLLLPILPALAASSPLVEGRRTGWLDSRLDVYRGNSARIASIAGRIIPEPVFDQAAYDRDIFAPMYADIAPHDPDELLRDEFLNARGAIARFSRGTIEIRVLDVQECPRADLAIVAAVTAVLQALVAETWTSLREQQAWPVEPLAEILWSASRDADAARIDRPVYLRALGMTAKEATAGEVWRHLLDVAADRLGPAANDYRESWEVFKRHGPLARRIDRRLPAGQLGRDALAKIYRDLCECLAAGEMFVE